MDANGSRMAALRNELLTDLANTVNQTLIEYGVTGELADQVGSAVADRVADHWGGQTIFIPKEHAFKIAKRDLEIYTEFDGNNHSFLGRKYNLSVRTIYKIIERVRKQRIEDHNQMDLFPDG